MKGIFIYSDPVSKENILTEKNIKEIDQLIVHIKSGCLSDPIDVPLYYENG